jgi:hypothetical protein
MILLNNNELNVTRIKFFLDYHRMLDFYLNQYGLNEKWRITVFEPQGFKM